MDKKIYFAVVALVGMSLTACHGTKKADASATTDSTQVADMHNADNALDYLGKYQDTIPAADCPGIIATLILKADKSYSLNYVYIDRDSEFTDHGTFSVQGNILTLKDQDGRESYYKIEEGLVRMLDADKKEIDNDLRDQYLLTKVH